MDFMRTKSVEQSIAETDEPEHQLKKNLGTLDLIIFGVGVIIGAGIFVITGTVAKTNSGPAITNEIAMAGPEFEAATVPVSTKIPAPMMTPTPKTTRSSAPRFFFS